MFDENSREILAGHFSVDEIGKISGAIGEVNKRALERSEFATVRWELDLNFQVTLNVSILDDGVLDSSVSIYRDYATKELTFERLFKF